MPDELWVGPHRAWQYAGDVKVENIQVDISCSNLPLAPPPRAGDEGVMTAAEVQQALKTLGWPFEVDGTMGDKTTEAVRDFQRGFAFGRLIEDGDPGPRTCDALRLSLERDGRCSENFRFREFKSKGNGWIKLSRELVLGLEDYRKLIGGPMTIVSGYRDPKRNHDVGGKPRSQHLYGNAIDLVAVKKVKDVSALRRFSGIGYYDEKHARAAPGRPPRRPELHRQLRQRSDDVAVLKPAEGTRAASRLVRLLPASLGGALRAPDRTQPALIR